MAEALTQKKIDALAKKRPTAKLEIADGGQAGLYLAVGPRVMKWIVRYRAASQNVKLGIGDYGQQRPALGLHDARKAAQAKLQEVSEGRDPRLGGNAAKRRNLAVEEAFDDFIDRHGKAKNKASTVDDNQGFIDREIKPQWRGRKIQSISRHDIVDLVDGIAHGKRDAEGNILAPGRPQSAVRVRALLSKAFSWFAAKGIVVDNPFRDIEVPAPPVARDRVLSDDEIRWFWQATDEIGWPFGDLARLLLLTAQRRDEVAAAPWTEFEFGQIEISPSTVGDLSPGQLAQLGQGADIREPLWSIPPERTKNGRRQNLPLVRQVVEILRALPRYEDDDGNESPFILSTNARTPISGYSKAKKDIDAAMLLAAREEAGDPTLSIAPWTFHDLRRTAASGMARLGVAVHVVEAVLNHKSGKISGVAAIYNRHDYAREKREALTAWANLVDSIVIPRQIENVIPIRR
ncbi:site-specific integrase [Mesorhizobium sp. WSM3626]|uniref:tyrosine-type recombinase/integrase n=1 Tax=Mesorhizobium sp. WSM3626 TaxID=1040987 RepID=UPI0004846AF2|nr:site-specific integrase [Mesorhizobium sp. WSM3626]